MDWGELVVGALACFWLWRQIVRIESWMERQGIETKSSIWDWVDYFQLFNKTISFFKDVNFEQERTRVGDKQLCEERVEGEYLPHGLGCDCISCPGRGVERFG